MDIKRLDDMFVALQGKPKKNLVAAYANDDHTIGALYQAVQKGIINATLVGDEEEIKKVCKDNNYDLSNFTVVHEPVDVKAAAKAVELIHEGKGEMLMKGLVSTDKFMRSILNKEKGLLPPKGTLSHVTVMENDNYHKLLVVGDVAIIPMPDLKQKITITNNVAQTARALGVANPKVALISATEQVLPQIASNAEFAVISKMNQRGQIKGCVVDGPLSIDAAIDEEAVKIKKVQSPVAGDADCLVFSNIEAGNVFYKTSTKLAKARIAALVLGAKVPTILSSRGDTTQDKLNSIALSCLLAHGA